MNIAQNWRMNAQRYGLKGNQCEHCGTVHFPPRRVCPNCQAKQPEVFDFSTPKLDLTPVVTAYELRQAAR